LRKASQGRKRPTASRWPDKLEPSAAANPTVVLNNPRFVLRFPLARLSVKAWAFSLGVAGLLCALVAVGAAEPGGSAVTLRQAAQERKLLVGAAVFPEGLKDEAYAAVLAREFNALTPENAMKWEPIHPNPNEWRFEDADRLVEFAASKGMKVAGHTLVWHQQVPDYLKWLPARELRRAMRRHIREVVGRYKGKVHSWDVVNEAIDDKEGLRKTLFLERLGDGYIAEAFRAAHKADPAALLYYNDYGCDGTGPKAERLFNLLLQLQADQVPIHGVGLQMHVTGRDCPKEEDLAANLRRLAGLGLRVRVSEMDVRIRDLPGTLPERLEVQAQVYRRVLTACLRESRFEGVTFWGFTDKHSWIHKQFGEDNPLLFDDKLQPKPAYQAVSRSLLGK
jgi:endo-1,4-beta-xylanase